ncbi:DUF4189 domain-containing protein [Xanthomonas euroxanthea]|uniref:DUF4189 domain-containing protein n=1 Tax=Xanthomonas euroxanthea TaxID=2259622 RepID=UPI002DD6575C|nr:DUF4189 domain-containing protein [Xanthomonas euroxanthea]
MHQSRKEALANKNLDHSAGGLKLGGAISLDKSSVGALGVSTGKLSKSEAEQDAIAGCVKAGGKECKKWNSYKNQCAAVAEPYQNGHSSAETICRLPLIQCQPKLEVCG